MHNLFLLLQDIFTFLSQTQAQPVKLVGPHRLAPSAVAQINALFAVRENIPSRHAHDRQGHWQKNSHPQKSELYTTRLRFVHYLCESANLVTPSSRQLIPTLDAAPYLAQNHSAQARLLFESGFPSAPTRAQRERWRNFKLPDYAIGAPYAFAEWLIHILRELPPAQNIKLHTLLKLYRDAERANRFVAYESDDPTDAPENLIRAHLELVHQFDIVALRDQSFAITPFGAALFDNALPAPESLPQPVEPLRWTRSKKTNTLPDLIATARADTQHLWQLTAIADHVATLTSTRINRRLYRLDAEKIRRALDQNLTGAHVHEFLETITANALPVPVSAWLHQITDTYGQITLRRVTLLETDEPAQLNALTKSKTVRACIQRTLSPRAVVVKPHRVQQLARTLVRNADPSVPAAPRVPFPRLELPEPSSSLPNSEFQFPNSQLAHLYLAARLTQHVQTFNPRAYQIPSAVASNLAEKISAHDREIADALARELVTNLRVQQKSRPTASRSEQDLVPAIDFQIALEKIQRALQTNAKLQITYYSPYQDETTTRVIEPLRLETHDHHHYVIAYCHRDRAERTFRVDRIMQIADSESRLAKRQARIVGR